MIDSYVAIRSIQHYLYCPHRWGLLEIDCAWAENYYVTKSDLMHKRVHENGGYSSRAKTVYTAVEVYCDLPQYKLYGVTDCIEVNSAGEYSIIEYKPTKPKSSDYNFDDLMQVFAQKICVDHVFNCDCSGYLYYADVKKRIKLPLSEEYNTYNNILIQTIAEINYNKKNGIIPPVKKDQKCSGCSMKDMCMPKLKKFSGVENSIRELLEKPV